MADLASLIAWRDALEAARYGGVRQVSAEGRTVEYKSDAEMKTALLDLNRRIAAESGQSATPFINFSTSKGL